MAKYIENVDYELVPDSENQDSWSIRILKGDFEETVIQFGNIGIDNRNDEGIMTFNYHLKYTPIIDLTEDDEDLQQVAADILTSVIEKAIEDEEDIKFNEVKS